MAVEDQHRRQLQEVLVDQIGSGPTDTLMGYLPPVGWVDVATKHDVQTMKQDLNALQAVMHAEINELGADLRAELHREMGALSGDLRKEMAALSDTFQTALRTQFYWTVTLLVLLMTAFVAALKLA